MNAFFESAVTPSVRPFVRGGEPEPVPWHVSDKRLERREEARKRAKNRTGDRRDR